MIRGGYATDIRITPRRPPGSESSPGRALPAIRGSQSEGGVRHPCSGAEGRRPAASPPSPRKGGRKWVRTTGPGAPVRPHLHTSAERAAQVRIPRRPFGGDPSLRRRLGDIARSSVAALLAVLLFAGFRLHVFDGSLRSTFTVSRGTHWRPSGSWWAWPPFRNCSRHSLPGHRQPTWSAPFHALRGVSLDPAKCDLSDHGGAPGIGLARLLRALAPRKSNEPAEPRAELGEARYSGYSGFGVCPGGTVSSGGGGGGGVPSPKGRPPRPSRSWVLSQPASSGPTGTMPVGLMFR